jgi:uncharacterized protein (TIGR02284 family)
MTAFHDEKTAKVLDDLMTINNDRIEGYEKASEETRDPELKSLFVSLASRSHRFNNELSAELRRRGRKPSDRTTTSGKIFRVWMDVKSTLTGKDRERILGSCETGEDAALKTYRDALDASDTPLDDSVRLILERQRRDLQQDHDRIVALKEAITT